MSHPDDIPDPETLLRHGASVRALAVAILRDPSAADDVAQETFLAALRGGAAPVRDAGAWLRGVTRNLARKWIRTEARRRRREESVAEPVAPASPEETAERLETETALTDAVRALPEPYRTVVVLRYFDGLSTAETAARTGAPEATVKTRLRRALAMLREALDDRYGGRAAWIPLLVRISEPRAPVAATTAAGTTALVAGGVIMAKKFLIIAVVGAVLVAVGVSTIFWEGDVFAPPLSSDPGSVPEVVRTPEQVTEPGESASEATAAATPRDRPGESFRVIVRHADDSPAENALVRLVAGVGQAREARTDAEGAASLPATGGRAVLQVEPRDAVSESREVEAVAGAELVVTLRTGSVISGTLYFGDERAAGVEVNLDSLTQEFRGLVTVTDDRGGFRFTGLTPGARCYLFAGWDVYFVDPEGDHNVDLVAPATDIAIRARRYPSVRGTVVRPDGRPVAGAVVRLSYGTEEGEGGSTEVTAGEDGRFKANAIARGRFEELVLTVTAPGTASREIVKADPARMGETGLDLGRIVLRSPLTFRFRVSGPDGKPVPGAMFGVPGDRSWSGRPTDAAGETELEVTAGTGTVVVGAPGQGLTEVRLPEEPSGPIPVKLPGGTLLAVKLRTAEGAVPPYLGLTLEADARLTDVTEDLLGRIYGRVGASSPHAWHVSDELTRLDFGVPENGTVLIAGILPGVPFRLTVHDRVTKAVLETRELRLGTRERRAEEFVLKLAERTLVVRVRDQKNRPLPGAWVTVSAPRSIRVTTDESGVARIPNVRGRKIEVEVEKSGRVPFVAAFPFESLPAELRVVLEEGRTVRLRVQDASGNPVAGEDPEARAPDLAYRFRGDELEAGLYGFRDLPRKEVTLSVRYAGRELSTVAGPADEEARIIVPATGSVVVRFEGRLDEPVTHLVRLVPTGEAGGAEVVVDIGYNPRRDRWEVRLPAVMPGAYRISLEHWVESDEDGVDRYETCRAGPVVNVTAGQEAEARLRR